MNLTMWEHHLLIYTSIELVAHVNAARALDMSYWIDLVIFF